MGQEIHAVATLPLHRESDGTVEVILEAKHLYDVSFA